LILKKIDYGGKMIILEFTLLFLLFCLSAKIVWAGEAKTGDWAKSPSPLIKGGRGVVKGVRGLYKVMKNEDTLPHITHIEMSIPGSEVVDEKTYLWWQLTAFENERIRYTIKLLGQLPRLIENQSGLANVVIAM
jgi:hypothetical protein